VHVGRSSAASRSVPIAPAPLTATGRSVRADREAAAGTRSGTSGLPTSSRGGGRPGPCCRATLISWGSSSSWSLRRKLPTCDPGSRPAELPLTEVSSPRSRRDQLTQHLVSAVGPHVRNLYRERASTEAHPLLPNTRGGAWCPRIRSPITRIGSASARGRARPRQVDRTSRDRSHDIARRAVLIPASSRHLRGDHNLLPWRLLMHATLRRDRASTEAPGRGSVRARGTRADIHDRDAQRYLLVWILGDR